MASDKEKIEFDKSLLFGEMENPFGEIEATTNIKDQPLENAKVNMENTKEEHIEKPFKGELTLDEPLKETIVILQSKFIIMFIEKGCYDNL